MTSAVPAEGRSKPRSMAIVVVLPAPLGPKKPNTSPPVNLEIETIHRGQFLETFGQVSRADYYLLLCHRLTPFSIDFPGRN